MKRVRKDEVWMGHMGGREKPTGAGSDGEYRCGGAWKNRQAAVACLPATSTRTRTKGRRAYLGLT